LKSINFVAASACCWQFSRQIGASTATTAFCACSFAIRSAVLPSVHPKDEKPITDIAAAPTTAPQIAGFRLGYFFINGALMSGDLSPDLPAADRGPERELVRYPIGT